MIGNVDRRTPSRGALPLFGALLGCLFLPSPASAQDGSPVTRAQFESNLNQGLYSYEIKEFTRQERLAVGAWNGSNHDVVRWGRSGGNDQRFLFLPEAGGRKFRLQTLRPDVKDRIFVGISPGGAAVTRPRSDDNSQLFQIEWQPDGKLALREGTRGEFLDISGGGSAVRWSGVDGRNDRPKSNQVFQLYAPQRYAAFVPSRWMKQIPDDRLLSQLSIPGTHDAAARHGVGGRCQDWKIAPQLEAGVRFLDIRCRRVGKPGDASFAIHHGVIFQGLMFGDVLNDCLAFLSQNPSECIVMSVMEEHTPERADLPAFGETFRAKYWQPNRARWHTEGTVPNLGKVRGKIVLLSRFGEFADQRPITWGGSGFVIEDAWQVFADNFPGKLGLTGKWNQVKANLEAARNASGNPPRWYVTSSAGSTGLLPETVAANLNPRLESFFDGNEKGRYGIVMMDFVPEKVTRQIIETN